MTKNTHLPNTRNTTYISFVLSDVRGAFWEGRDGGRGGRVGIQMHVVCSIVCHKSVTHVFSISFLGSAILGQVYFKGHESFLC